MRSHKNDGGGKKKVALCMKNDIFLCTKITLEADVMSIKSVMNLPLNLVPKQSIRNITFLLLESLMSKQVIWNVISFSI